MWEVYINLFELLCKNLFEISTQCKKVFTWYDCYIISIFIISQIETLIHAKTNLSLFDFGFTPLHYRVDKYGLEYLISLGKVFELSTLVFYWSYIWIYQRFFFRIFVYRLITIQFNFTEFFTIALHNLLRTNISCKFFWYELIYCWSMIQNSEPWRICSYLFYGSK